MRRLKAGLRMAHPGNSGHDGTGRNEINGREKAVKKAIVLSMLLALLVLLCAPASAGNWYFNIYLEKETLNEQQALEKNITSKDGELRVVRQSVYPWDEEGNHWAMFVELENTSDNLIVLDETWLYTCKADKETTATWHFPLIDGAFYRTASRFYPGERVILYAGSEPVYALQYDAQGQYTGKEVCAEGLDQIAEEMRSASLLRVRINSRDTTIGTAINSNLDEVRVPVQAQSHIADGKLTLVVQNDQEKPVTYKSVGAVLSDAQGNIVDVLRWTEVAEPIQPGESLTIEKELLPYVTDAMLEGAQVEPYAYMFREDVDAL